MQGPFDQNKAVLAQRMANSGATPSGLNPPSGSPPPQMGGQQPLGGAPTAGMGMGMGQQPSEAKPLLDQVFQILIRGNPADLDALGEFMARVSSLVQQHSAGQGQMQMGAAPPAMPTP